MTGYSAAVSGSLAGEFLVVERMWSWQLCYTISDGFRWSTRNSSAGCSVLHPVCT